MKRLIYFTLVLFLFFSCEKQKNPSIVGQWELYSIQSKDIIVDTIAGVETQTNLVNYINAIHIEEDSSAVAQKLLIEFTSEGSLLKNSQPNGNYTFNNHSLRIYNTDGELSLDSVFMNDRFLSYTFDRTSLFKDSVLLRSYSFTDSIHPTLIQKVSTRYNYRR